MELSFENLVTSATLITSSSELDGYEASNAQYPERPFLPWRSGALGAQSFTIDFGASKDIGLVLIANVNFTTARIQGNATNSWGSPTLNQLITIRRNPQMWRYQHGLLIRFTHRWLRISISDQTPVDGATYYQIGGVWAGSINTMPRPWRWDAVYETLDPFKDVGPASGAWRQRLHLGEPIARLTVNAYSTTDEHQPGDSDQLRDWSEIERKMRVSDFFAVAAEVNDLYDESQVIVARRVNMPAWSMTELALAETVFELEEVTSN